MRKKIRRILSDKPLAELIFGSGVALSLKVLAAFSVFLLNIVIARRLGAEDAGLFFLGFSLVNILSGVSRLGYDKAIVKCISIAKSEHDFSRISGCYWYAWIRSFLIALLVSILLYFSADFIAVFVFNKLESAIVIQLVSLVIVPFSLTWFNGFAFQGQKNIPLNVTFLSLAIPFSTLVGIYILDAGDVKTAQMALLAGSVFSFAVSMWIWLWKYSIGFFHSYFDKNEARQFQATANSLFGLKILSLIVIWGSPVVVGMVASSEEVAVFSAAQRTAGLIGFVLVAVNAISAPNFAVLFKQGNLLQLERMAVNSSRLLLISTMPIAFIMVAFPSLFIGLFGRGFSDGENCLVVLALGQFVNVVTGSVGNMLVMTGYERYFRNSLILSASILVIGCWVVTPIYGAFGASVVTAFSVAFSNIICVLLVRKYVGINTLFWVRNRSGP